MNQFSRRHGVGRRTAVRYSAAAFCAAAVTLGAPAGQADSAKGPAQALQYLERMKTQTGAPGVSGAVSVNGKIVFSGGTGIANLEANLKQSGTVVHNIGSTSKAVAVVGLMKLVEEGKVKLTDEIQVYAPWFPRKARPITVWNILTHTSGIGHYQDFKGYQAGNGAVIWHQPPEIRFKHYDVFEESTRDWRDQNLVFETGKYWKYTSFGSNLIHAFVEKASGETFESYLRRTVWQPAGMTATQFDVPSRIVANRGRGYYKNEKTGQYENDPGEDVSYKYAGGGILSTDEDLVKFGHALNAGLLLKPATLKEMYRPQLKAEITETPAALEEARKSPSKVARFVPSKGQALIWRVQRDSAGRLMTSHAGGVKNTTSHLINYPEQDVAVAISFNCFCIEDIDGAAQGLAELFLPAGAKRAADAQPGKGDADEHTPAVANAAALSVGIGPFAVPVASADATVRTAAAIDASRATRPLKIAAAYFVHETTTFSPEKVGINDFVKPDLQGDALLSHGAYMQGFVKVARETAGVTLVPLTSPNDVIGSSAKGWIQKDAFEHYMGQMLKDLKAALPVDGVYLSLHGAAAVEGIARPEAELAKRVRALVGPNVPIAGTFDLHGNEDEEFLRYANFSYVVKYFPHYDGYLQGERAARSIIRTARGDYRPTTATRRPGIVTPTVLQWTGQQPFMAIAQRALTWEARHPDVYVSYFLGFPWSDVPDLGATFQVMTNGDQKLADTIAQDMSDYMWRRRSDLESTPIVAPKKAVADALAASSAGKTPIVLADYSDRTGDATHILREVVDQNLGGVLVATLRDEHVLDALRKEKAKAGDAFDRDVGGYVVPPASGKPVRVRGKLVFFGQPGPGKQLTEKNDEAAVVEFGRGNYLAITSGLVQVTNPEDMRWGPIDPAKFTTWVIKSRAHFRAGFDDNSYAKTIMIVDAPGPYLGTVHLDALPYKNAKLDALYPYRPGDRRT